MARLGPLIRIARARVDEQRRALAERLHRSEDLAAECRRIQAAIAKEAALIEASVAESDGSAGPEESVSLHFGTFVAQAEADRLDNQAEAARLEAEIDAAREALTKSYRDLRAIELTEQARLRKLADAEVRRDRSALDETAVTRHRRRAAP
ncbi:MAG: hypothetical protein EA406_11510 [Rhodospirillales bacterium]|nr:MAG: hypothetical protein EA406_11510 [Rhodospirillales bacterium]